MRSRAPVSNYLTRSIVTATSGKMTEGFKIQHSLEKRIEESGKMRKKHADRVPVICERAHHSDIPDIDHKKYLVPQELTVGQFIYVIRKRIRLAPEKAIFLFVNGVLPSTGTARMSQMYRDYADHDGFLYITYSSENTFGLSSLHCAQY